MVHDDDSLLDTQIPSTASNAKIDDSICESHKPRKRNPLDSLSSFVNSLEIKSMGTKISHSASSIRRTVSHRFADLPLFPAEETSDEFDYENESTLNDDDWLASPSSKQRLPLQKQSLMGEPDFLHHFSSNEHLPNTNINTFTVAQDNLPRIDENEMRKILEGEYANQFDEVVVIDCRFPYEYAGGHISQAINISSQQSLEEKFLNCDSTQSSCRKLLIFHCEYSLLRGPTLATHLRKVDRHINAHRYPYLHYPDIVVLERGYRGFFDKFRNFCEPQGYVEMNDNNHKRACEIEMSKILQASKLTRAKSFNQCPPRLTTHARSASLTALLSNSETSSPANTAPSLRSRKSLKIKKRERKDTRPQFTQSLSTFSNSCESPQKDSPVYARFDHDDFMPPTALFRNYSKSFSGSMLSINSSSSSICSEALSPTFSSSESLSESMSPFNDKPDFFNSVSTFDSIDVSTISPSTANFIITQESHSECNSGKACSSNVSIQKATRPTLARPNLRACLKLENPSPVFSSPLTLNSESAFASRQDASLMSDSSIDTPVE
ncbi:hypothetical protein JCM33374_g5009 [Metschnikowia sp. JCM 33374]|nr:hypothetical protein JCM33374_g5009 [Metschnikowia sp. JCM 33374]